MNDGTSVSTKSKLYPAGIILSLIILVSCSLTHTAFAQQVEADTFTPLVQNVPQIQADILYYDAVKARLKGEDKESEQLLHQVIKLTPDAAGAYFDLARLNMKQNKVEKATEYIKKAVALDNTNPWFQSQYAEILILANKFDEAAKVYDNLAKQERYNDEYLYKSAGLYAQTGKYKEAMDALNKMIEKDGEDEEMLLRKHELYLKMNDLDGAANMLRKIIDKNPQEGRYYAILAEMYENNKQPAKAKEVYEQALKKFPDDPIVQLSLANYYRKNNDTAKYNEFALKAITNKSLDAQQQLAFLIDYIRSQGTDTAKREDILEMTKLIAEQHKDNAEVLGVYGDILNINSRREDAIEQYKRSLVIDPSRYQVWQNLLYQYTETRYSDSLILYTGKALRLFPNQASLHYLQGIGLSNKKDYKEAAKSVNRAIDMQPEDDTKSLSEMYATLGDIYNSSKQYSQSDEAFKKSLELQPENPFTLNNYSYYLSLRGKNLEEAERMSKLSL